MTSLKYSEMAGIHESRGVHSNPSAFAEGISLSRAYLLAPVHEEVPKGEN